MVRPQLRTLISLAALTILSIASAEQHSRKTDDAITIQGRGEVPHLNDLAVPPLAHLQPAPLRVENEPLNRAISLLDEMETLLGIPDSGIPIPLDGHLPLETDF